MLPLLVFTSTRIVSCVLLRTKLSAAFTKISSKILYSAGTYSSLRRTIRPSLASKTQWSCDCRSVDPTYESGRSRMCSNWVFFWYVSSTVFCWPPFSPMPPFVAPLPALRPIPAAPCAFSLSACISDCGAEVMRDRCCSKICASPPCLGVLPAVPPAGIALPVAAFIRFPPRPSMLAAPLSRRSAVKVGLGKGCLCLGEPCVPTGQAAQPRAAGRGKLARC
mmetsp:Transcript_146245/g.364685  ORF Transcript_146245/g.364685 Transcript_146245/m.364685 type:complete len:221 (-) Transcript_146245:8-670(-)